MRRLLCSLLALLLVPTAPRVTLAAWLQTGNPLCTVPEDLNAPIGYPQVICDFHCGDMLTVFWQDARSNYGSIYTAYVWDAQPPDPQPVEPGTLFIQRPGQQIPGGAVGVYPTNCLTQTCNLATVFVWTDAPDGAPSVIRMRRDSGADWGPDGKLVATSTGSQHDPRVIHDLHGGAITVWLDETPDHRLVYAQRLDSVGTRLWGDAGVLVGSDTTVQTRPQLAPDRAGGAYVLREDLRGGVRTLALFRLAPDGSIATGWPASGVVLGTAPQDSPEPLLRAGASGAWVVWSELATLSDNSLSPRPLVSFVDLAGAVSPVFTAAGTPIASGLDGDALADDATVGPGDDLIVAYEYTQRLPAPAASSTDLYAARFDVEGSHPDGWSVSGRLVCGAPGVQRQVRVVGAGDSYYGSRAFFAWTDERTGDGDIYAQELMNDGTLPPNWPVNGLLVCGVAGTQQDPVIGPNTVGGGFVIWRDGRDAITNNWDLYGQTVSGDARLDTPPLVVSRLALSAPRPNPARAAVSFHVELPAVRSARFEVLDVAGRLVHREALASGPGAHDVVWDMRTDAGAHARPGLYLVRVRAGSFEQRTRVVVTE